MELFEKKIKKIKRTNSISIITISIITVMSLIFAVVELIPKEYKTEKFSKNQKSSRYVYSKIEYLMGPILQSKNTKNNKTYNFFIATDEDEQDFIIKIEDGTNNIPILGKDISEEEIDNIGGIEVIGSATEVSSTMRNAISNSLQEIMQIYNNSQQFSNYIGYYYFDCSVEESSIANNLFIISIIFALIDVIYILLNKKICKNVNSTIERIKNENKYDEIKKEYESNDLIEYKNLKVSISRKYIFSYLYGLSIIAFDNIKEVHATKNINGINNKYKYIVIDTKDGLTYCIAPLQKRNQKTVFNELLENIKSRQR